MACVLASAPMVGARADEARAVGSTVPPALGLALAELHTRYLQALRRLEVRLTREQRLNDAWAVRLEFDRFRERLARPEPARLAHERLVELATIYLNERARLEERHRDGPTAPELAPLAGDPVDAGR